MSSLVVIAGSRLHFGLTRVGRGPGRYNGAGVMIQAPATHLRIEAADSFSPDGPERLGRYAFAWLSHLRAVPPMCRISTVSLPPDHSGLGSGTQLAHAVAAGLSAWLGLPPPHVLEVARVLNRGKRSLVGSLGFAHGGLIVDRAAAGGAAPLPGGPAKAVAGLPTGSGDAVGARIEMPADWRVVLVRHCETPLIWGDREDNAFQSLAGTDDDRGGELESLIDERMLPAARGADFDAFSEAVYEYGRLSGLYYRGIQGGPYNGPAVGRAVACLREIGIAGTGQSSWGPTVFGWCRDEDHAAAALRQLESRLGAEYERWISQVQNTPALTRFQTDPPSDSARSSTEPGHR